MSPGPAATFFLSTGRCGTQWLTEVLAQALAGRARVEHEPLHLRYAPRRMLGAGDPAALEPGLARPILDHAAAIERELATRDYVETGHPCWSSVPWLARRFAGRVRVVHLVRHPVRTACSWLSHGAFVPPPLPHLPAKELISPDDAGVAHPDYRGCWADLSAFEKCLYYWAEVNAFALRCEAEAGVPWLRLRYEDLFAAEGTARAQLVAFLGWPAETGLDRSERVDEFRYALAAWPELDRVGRHAAVAVLAAKFGYALDDFAPDELAARFFAPEG